MNSSASKGISNLSELYPPRSQSEKKSKISVALSLKVGFSFIFSFVNPCISDTSLGIEIVGFKSHVLVFLVPLGKNLIAANSIILSVEFLNCCF